MTDTDRDADGVYTGPDEKTVTLTKPVKRKGFEDLTAVTVCEPDAKQLSAYFKKLGETNDNGIEALIHLIASTSGHPHIDIEKIKQRDLDELGRFFEVFTRVPPKPTSAP